MTGYLSKINHAKIIDCEPYQSSLFESPEQTFLLVVEIDEQLQRLKISEREKEIVVKHFKQEDEVIVIEEQRGDAVSVDVVWDNCSFLKNNMDNVIRVNEVLNHQETLFDEAVYEGVYNAFEYTYERMTEVSKENVETLYLYFNALSKHKNSQNIRAGTEELVKVAIKVAFNQDVPFKTLIDIFDLDSTHNIKAIVNETDENTKSEFFKSLVDTKTALNTTESEVFRNLKDLNINKVGEAIG